MRSLILFLLVFSATIKIYGQITYTSPITQTWPNLFETNFEDIKRTLYFEIKLITIVTETSEGKVIERLEIQDFQKVQESLLFFCLTPAEEKVTVVMPPQEKVEIIDLYRRSPKTGEEMQVRFHVD